jgi:hypothetical protein
MRFIGSGKSTKNAIKILGIGNHFGYVMAEYQYLSMRFGEREKDWKLKKQQLITEGDKHYDKMVLEFPDGTQEIVYFDVSPFFKMYEEIFEEHEKGGTTVNKESNDTYYYADGYIELHVSDIERAFNIVHKYNIPADISTDDKTINLKFGAGSYPITIEKLISILQELKPICIPLEDPLFGVLKEEEEEEEDKSIDNN